MIGGYRRGRMALLALLALALGAAIAAVMFADFQMRGLEAELGAAADIDVLLAEIPPGASRAGILAAAATALADRNRATGAGARLAALDRASGRRLPGMAGWRPTAQAGHIGGWSVALEDGRRGMAAVRDRGDLRLVLIRPLPALSPLGGPLALIGLTALILFGLAGFTAARLLSADIRRRADMLAATCLAVERGDLAARAPPLPDADPLAALSRRLDAMLARLVEHIVNLRDASDRIAHDLRSPLSRVAARLAMVEHGGEPPDPGRIDAARAESNA